MFKKISLFLAMFAMLATVLVACGDEPFPVYTGATPVSVPDSIKSQLDFKDVKKATLTAYKTSDNSGQVKTFFIEQLTKANWKDNTDELLGGAGITSKLVDKAGGFFLSFHKDKKTAVIVGVPGVGASLLGVQGVGLGDTLYIVFSGVEA